MVLLSQDFNGSTNVLTTYLQDQECKTLFLQVKRIREKKETRLNLAFAKLQAGKQGQNSLHLKISVTR